jgi:hypothetical protein
VRFSGTSSRVGDLAIKNAARLEIMAGGVFELGPAIPPVKGSSEMGGLGSRSRRIISGPSAMAGPDFAGEICVLHTSRGLTSDEGASQEVGWVALGAGLIVVGVDIAVRLGWL